MKPARTRFAPSPTGYLHVGGIRTALFNYLWAKKTGGQFILRLEDTDRERYVAEGVGQIVESLEWLGLKPDEGFWLSEGKHQSVEHVQSERHKRGFYQQYADLLLESGVAYRDWTSSEKISQLRDQARKDKKPFLFRKDMAILDGDETKPHVLRFDVTAHQPRSAKWQESIDWEDAVRGHLQARYKDIEDFILIKSDGFPTYNFANVADDHDMAITHVLRGEEFIPSTPKHLLLYEALGFDEPVFAHLSVINGLDGKKLSKRTGDANTLDYRDTGYPTEALLNFLALLGWNDGTTQELYSPDELIATFKLEDINSSPAVFDQKRLDWMSGQWIRDRIGLDDLYERSKGFWPETAGTYDDGYKQQVLGITRERLKYFTELPTLTAFFFEDLPVDPALISQNKRLGQLPPDELRGLLEQARTSLNESDFSERDLSERLNQLLEQAGQKPAVLFSLIRIATTQAPASPGLADTLAVLGKERSLRRLDAQLSALN